MGEVTQVPFAVNVNWNPDDAQWNFNAYPRDAHRWNPGDRAFGNCELFLPALLVGSFVSKPLRQPPSIRPTSDSCSLRAIYFWLSKPSIKN